MSGIYQSGFPMGYVLAVVFYKAFHNTPNHWRSLFWFGAGVPVLLIIYRLLMDETDAWNQRKQFRNQQPSVREACEEVGTAIKRHWGHMLYLVFLLMGMMYLVSSDILQSEELCTDRQLIVPWNPRYLSISSEISVQKVGVFGRDNLEDNDDPDSGESRWSHWWYGNRLQQPDFRP